MLKRPEGKGIERVFDPLHRPVVESTELVLVVTTFLETGGMRRVHTGRKQPSHPDREFDHLIQDIMTFKTLKPSKSNPRIELILAVNGFVTEDYIIEYLQGLHDTYLQEKIHVTVFQRPNIGWQYGSMQDVYMRYKNVNVLFYMMKEVDRHLKIDYWYDILFEKMFHSNKKTCFVSGVERKYRFKPYEYDGPLTENVWRDKYNKPIKNPTKEITLTVKPHYYFIQPQFLHDMDKVYGCLTSALGSSYELDGIIYGEHCFAQRARALGYDWVQFTDSNFMESHGKPLYPTPINRLIY